MVSSSGTLVKSELTSTLAIIMLLVSRSEVRNFSTKENVSEIIKGLVKRGVRIETRILERL